METISRIRGVSIARLMIGEPRKPANDAVMVLGVVQGKLAPLGASRPWTTPLRAVKASDYGSEPGACMLMPALPVTSAGCVIESWRSSRIVRSRRYMRASRHARIGATLTSIKRKLKRVSGEPIARRTLMSVDTGHPIELVLFRPEVQQGEQGEWSCRLELRRGADNVAVLTGRGIDSLQALINAIGGFRSFFKDELARLTWFGVPRDVGLPKLISDDDPDFLALLEQVIETEYRRQALMHSRQRRRAERRTAEERHRLTKVKKKTRKGDS